MAGWIVKIIIIILLLLLLLLLLFNQGFQVLGMQMQWGRYFKVSLTAILYKGRSTEQMPLETAARDGNCQKFPF